MKGGAGVGTSLFSIGIKQKWDHPSLKLYVLCVFHIYRRQDQSSNRLHYNINIWTQYNNISLVLSSLHIESDKNAFQPVDVEQYQ